MKIQINKIWNLRTSMQFHRRHLEIAFQCFEEVQMNFGFPFYAILPSAFKIAVPHFEEAQKKPEGFF